jgi:hypothetical protein
MPGTSENIGGVSISITGDTTQLNAALSSAQANAAVAGGRVASAFTAGAASVDQMAAATVAAAAAEAGFAASTETAAAALGHQVSQLQAISGTIRTTLGEQSIRAAERFLAMIPGIGAALQLAFPVIGAIALASAIARVIEKSEDLKAAEKDLENQTKRTDEAYGEWVSTLDKIAVKQIGEQFGPAAQARAEAARLGAEANDAANKIRQLQSDIRGIAIEAQGHYVKAAIAGFGDVNNFIEATADKIKAKGKEIEAVQAKIMTLTAQSNAEFDDSGRKAQEQAGQLGAKQIEAAEQASARQAEISKQQYDYEIDAAHNAETQRIAGLESEYKRTVQTGQEEIRFAKAKADEIAGYALATRDRTIQEIAAKAGAESAGKSQPEQALIFAGAQADTSKAKQGYTLAVDKGALESQAAQQKAALSLIELSRKLAETLKNDLSAGWDRASHAADEAGKAMADAAEKDAIGKVRVQEIEDKGAGEVKALQIQAQKIALEGQYGAQVSHTLQQELVYMQQIAALEHDEREAEIAKVQAELADAEALNSQLRDLTKIASLKAEIAKLTQEDSNASAKSAGNAGATAAKGGFGDTLGNTVQQGAGQLTSAIATGVINGGKGLGKDIRSSLQNIGKELLGDALKKGTEELVIAVTGNTIATNINTLWTELNTLVHSIFGFADGTSSAPGGMAMVGEKGPEIMYVPRGAQIIPNHAIKGYADGTAGAASTYSSTAFQTGSTELHFHAHGMANPDQFIDHVMRKLPEALKRRSPQFSPLAH